MESVCLVVQAEMEPAEAELSEAAQTELIEKCEQQFAQLEKVISRLYLTIQCVL